MIDNCPAAVHARRLSAKWRIRKHRGWWCTYMPESLELYAKYSDWYMAMDSVLYSSGQLGRNDNPKWRIKNRGGRWYVFQPNQALPEPYSNYPRWQSAVNHVDYFIEEARTNG